MAIYDKEKDDRVFIPKWEYRLLRDIATRADVLMGEIAVLEKQNKEFNEKNETNYDCNVSTEFVKRIMSPRVVIKGDTTIDDLADVFSYTD